MAALDHVVPEGVAEHVRQHADAALPPALLGMDVREHVPCAPAQIHEEEHLGQRQEQEGQIGPQAQAMPAVRSPGQRREERDPHRAREHRQRAGSRAGPLPAVPRQRKCGEGEQQEEALGVRQREDERQREDREVQHRAPRDRLVVPAERHPVEEAEGAPEERRREQAAPELHRAREDRERLPDERVEREERRRVPVPDRRVVAVVGDPAVPDDVPLPERAEERVPRDARLARDAARPRRGRDQEVDRDPARGEDRQRVAVRREPALAGGLRAPDRKRRRLDGRVRHSGHPRQRQNRCTP